MPSEESPGLTFQDWNPTFTLLIGVVIGLVLATALFAFFGTGTAAVGDDAPASVSCTPFIDESGNASGMCFVYGDVEFEWLNQTNATNGTVSLDGLPADNSTVRREA